MKRVFRGCINRRACQAQQRNGVCLMVKGVKTCVTCSYGDLNQDHRCPGKHYPEVSYAEWFTGLASVHLSYMGSNLVDGKC